MSQSGSFAQLTGPEILRNVIVAASTGRLKVASGPYRRVVWFDKGRAVFATSTHPEEGFGEILVKAGKLGSDQLRQALAAAPSSRKVGAKLVELKLVSPPDLFWATNQQVREIILSLFTLSDGSFVFEEVDLATEDILRLNLKTETLVREGVKRMSDPRLLLRALGSIDGRMEAGTAGGPTAPAAFPLDAREKSLLDSIRRGPSSVRELCRRSGMPAIEACQTLVTLVAAGAARRASA